MTSASLADIFAALPPLPPADPERPLYAVQPVPNHSSYFIGKDGEGHACLLVTTADHLTRLAPPIRLESLDVQFELRCHLRKGNEPVQVGTFTVICCRSREREMTRYFLSICETVIRMSGDQPAAREIADVINRLTAIFQKMQRPPLRSVNGLFGELYLLSRSTNPLRAIAAWRTEDNARFDFAHGDIRLDVKTASGRLRIHTFSYEQCSPPPGTIGVVASLFVERASGGMALRSIIDEITLRIAANIELVFKLREVVSATLGTSLAEALSTRFDIMLADSSLRFFHVADIPAIRGAIPTGVSDIHFRSDLSAVAAVPKQALIDSDPMFWDLLPA
jgi:hypothetical protein